MDQPEPKEEITLSLVIMFRLSPENHDLAAAVLDAVILAKRQRAAEGVLAAIARISNAVHEIWELRDLGDNVIWAPQSSALRMLPSESYCIDHPVPQPHFAKQLLSLSKHDHRVPYISNLLHQYGFFCLVTPDEQERLNNAGLTDKMPDDWNGIDRYARYSAVGICIGEERIYERDELRRLLETPVRPFYAYRLRTPSGKVFYIGKGEGLRALTHEKEIFKKSLGTHTNWKKLNKIADIIHAGERIGYEIESWHSDETQAFLREDELILMAERANPWPLCNSNGRRWKGRPNQHLTALRSEHCKDQS